MNFLLSFAGHSRLVVLLAIAFIINVLVGTVHSDPGQLLETINLNKKLETQKRIEELMKIGKENGGSMQSDGVLSYTEYKDFQQGGWPEKMDAAFKFKFEAVYHSLLKKLRSFEQKNTKFFDELHNALMSKKNLEEKEKKEPSLTDITLKNLEEKEKKEPSLTDITLKNLEEEEKMEPLHLALTDISEKYLGKKFPDKLQAIMSGKKWHEFVLDCKHFMRELFTEGNTSIEVNAHAEQHELLDMFKHGGEASFLDIFSFMKYDQNDLAKAELSKLASIWQISQIQNEDLDQLYLASLYKMHLDMKEKALEKASKAKASSAPAVPFRRALVIGAGPIGLFTAFKLYMAGIDETTVVNDRSEHYSRKQIFYLDPKWMVQLRYFLGMKFDKIFMDPEKWVGHNKPGESVGHNKLDEPVGHIKPGEVGILRCQDLEYGLKERLVDLISFVHYQEEMASRRQHSHHVKDLNLKPSAENVQLNSPLHLLFEAAFIRHKEGRDGGFVAILGTPQGKSNPEQRKFYENLIKKGADKMVAAKNAKIGGKADAFNDLTNLDMGTDNEYEESKMGFKRDEEEKRLREEIIHGIAERIRQAATVMGLKKDGEDLIDLNQGQGRTPKWISPMELAQMEFNGETAALRQLPEVPFDILISAGGANAQLSQLMGLGKMAEQASTTHFGVAVIEKASTQFYIFAYGPLYQDLEIDNESEKMEMAQFLEEQKFDEVIGTNAELKGKYANFDELLLKGLADEGVKGGKQQKQQKELKMDEKGRLVAGDSSQPQLIRLWEIRSMVYLAASTPQAMEQLFKDLDAIKQRETGKLMKELKDAPEKRNEIDAEILKIVGDVRNLRQRIERKWFMAIFKFCLDKREKYSKEQEHLPALPLFEYNLDGDGQITDTLDQWKSKTKDHHQKSLSGNAHQKLFFDPANTSTFPVEIKSLPVPAKFLDAGKTLVMALGDALASPHFMSGSGLSSGRLGVEIAINFLTEYHQDLIKNAKDLLEKLLTQLKFVQDKVKNKAMTVNVKTQKTKKPQPKEKAEKAPIKGKPQPKTATNEPKEGGGKQTKKTKTTLIGNLLHTNTQILVEGKA